MSLDKLNSVGLCTGFRDKVDISMLEINKIYNIEQIGTKHGPYGRSVVIHLNLGIIFLPHRFSSVFTDELILEYNLKNMGIIYKGMRNPETQFATPMIEFVEL